MKREKRQRSKAQTGMPIEQCDSILERLDAFEKKIKDAPPEAKAALKQWVRTRRKNVNALKEAFE